VPFIGDPLREIVHENRPEAPSWAIWQATEGWAALVDDEGWGLGAWSPAAQYAAGGYYQAKAGATSDAAVARINLRVRDVLDSNVVYDSEVYLLVGTVDEIRNWVYQKRGGSLPDYRFQCDRQHWRFYGLRDQGWPVDGNLKLELGTGSAYMIGPLSGWRAEDAPKIYVRAAHHTANRIARFYWTTLGDPVYGFSEAKTIRFTVIPDGQVHTYELDLAAHPEYKGLITAIRFDPLAASEPGGKVEVYSISHK
jgi:hypothetical protein